jgi:hypothetical protein
MALAYGGGISPTYTKTILKLVMFQLFAAKYMERVAFSPLFRQA